MQLFVDHLTVIDCSYFHPVHGIEGESWIVDVALDGSLDAQSMIMDFGHVKKRLKAAIDEWVDHKLLVPRQSPHLQVMREEAGGIRLEWQDTQSRRWAHQSPEEALCLMDAAEVSTDTVRGYLKDCLMAELPDTVNALHINLRHEPLEDGLYYHYSHGLKKHDGNCQRIAHGHRSKLEIWRDGQWAADEIRQICSRWKHSYLVSKEDVISQTKGFVESGYDAPQGRFWLQAPSSACDILPGDSTVESIAEFLANGLSQRDANAKWRVKAYEGVRKGAIVER